MGKRGRKDPPRQSSFEPVVKHAKVLSTRDMDQYDDDISASRYSVPVTKSSSNLPVASSSSNWPAASPSSNWLMASSTHNGNSNFSSSLPLLQSPSPSPGSLQNAEILVNPFPRKPDSIKGTLRTKERPKRQDSSKNTTVPNRKAEVPIIIQRPSIDVGPEDDVDMFLYGDGTDPFENNKKKEENERADNTSHPINKDKNDDNKLSTSSSSRPPPSSKGNRDEKASGVPKPPRAEISELKMPEWSTNSKNPSIKQVGQVSGSGHRNSNDRRRSSSESAPVEECRVIVNSKERKEAADINALRGHQLVGHVKEFEKLKAQESQLNKLYNHRRDEITCLKLLSVQESIEAIQKKIDRTKRAIDAYKKQIDIYDKAKALRLASEVKPSLNDAPGSPKKSVIPGLSLTKPRPNVPAPTPEPAPPVPYRFVDRGNHWCKHCKQSFPHLSPYLQHLREKPCNVVEDIPPPNRPWAIKPKETKPETNLQSLPVQGAEFMLPCNAFFCELCQEFYGDGAAAKVHLESTTHNINYKKYIKVVPDYERKIDQERNASLLRRREEIERYLHESMRDAFKTDTFDSLPSDGENSQNGLINKASEGQAINPGPSTSKESNPENSKLKTNSYRPDVKLKSGTESKNVNEKVKELVDPRKASEKATTSKTPSTPTKPLESPVKSQALSKSQSSAQLDKVASPPPAVAATFGLDPRIKVKSEPKDTGYEKHMKKTHSETQETRSSTSVVPPSITRPIDATKIKADSVRGDKNTCVLSSQNSSTSVVAPSITPPIDASKIKVESVTSAKNACAASSQNTPLETNRRSSSENNSISDGQTASVGPILVKQEKADEPTEDNVGDWNPKIVSVSSIPFKTELWSGLDEDHSATNDGKTPDISSQLTKTVVHRNDDSRDLLSNGLVRRKCDFLPTEGEDAVWDSDQDTVADDREFVDANSKLEEVNEKCQD